MNEYINRTNAMKQISWYAAMKQRNYGQPLLTLDEVLGIIGDVSASNVVYAVKCKDCLHAKYNDYEGVYECGKLKLFVNGEFYCFYGIRRPNDE